nr:site-specific DNA-methyltransferase [Bradyrhizobium sp. URHD0069]
MLKTLPDDHFDCVVTSPPYWGLRDYGTGRWEGGDPDCDHRSPTMREGRNEDRAQLPGSAATNSAQLLLAHRSGCGKCGAVKVDHQIGLEPTLAEHLTVMVEVFEEVRRVLKPTGTLWLNYGDCYATSPNGRSAADTKAAGNDDRTFRDKPFSTIGGVLKAKDLCMIPNRLAIALQEAGWYVRSEIIWHKPNPMPESIKDRPGTSHEKVWLLSKSPRYFYDHAAVAERATHAGKTIVLGEKSFSKGQANGLGIAPSGNGAAANFLVGETKNLRNVWTIPTSAFAEAHFATFPPELAERCIKAGCPEGGRVLDPFGGSGTTALVAARLGLDSAIIELNPEYAILARARIEAAFMGKEEGSRHMVKQLGKDKAPFEPGSLFAGIEGQAAE